MTAAEIKTALRGRALDVCLHLFPAGRRNGDEYEIGNLTGAPGASLKVNINGKAGVWSDFATDEGGDNLLELWRRVRGLDITEAMREAAEWLGSSATRTSRRREVSTPVDVPKGHPKWLRSKPVAIWCYTDTNGAPWIIVYRYNNANGKKAFFQFDYRAKKWVEKGGHQLPDLRPLYQLGAFATRPASTIVLVEGEKCADALVSLGIDATSTLGGSGQVRQADFSPLRGWRVLIWQDADDAGRRYAETAAAMLQAVGAEPSLVPIPDGKAEGWDVADAIRDGWTEEEIRAQLDAAVPVPTSSAANAPSALRRLDTVEVVPPTFRIWRPYFPDALVIVAGDAGVGKTWCISAVIAHASRGWPLPDQSGKPPAGVVLEAMRTLYLSVENEAASAAFRLKHLGADLTQVTIWDTAIAPLPTLNNMAPLESALASVQPQLLVIDPLQSMLGGRMDVHRMNEVRAVLDPLAALARKHRCTPVVLMHLNKSTMAQALYRVSASVDFVAAARSVLMVARDPARPERRIMAHVKINLGRLGASQAFIIDGTDEEPSFGWMGTSDLTADELLSAPVRRSEQMETKQDGAVAFLQESLASGDPVARRLLEDQALARGISADALKRAAKQLRIKYSSAGFPRFTTWSLP